MKFFFLALTLLATINVYAQQPDTDTSVPSRNIANNQIIANAGATSTIQGATQYFTGQVRVDPLLNLHDPNRAIAYVSFEPNARSAWHTHPKGQLLIVTEGTGLTQEWGGTINKIKKGDVIWCPPNIKHWHGAATDSSMTHISYVEALSGENVYWMEKVTDEQYNP